MLLEIIFKSMAGHSDILHTEGLLSEKVKALIMIKQPTFESPGKKKREKKKTRSSRLKLLILALSNNPSNVLNKFSRG